MNRMWAGARGVTKGRMAWLRLCVATMCLCMGGCGGSATYKQYISGVQVGQGGTRTASFGRIAAGTVTVVIKPDNDISVGPDHSLIPFVRDFREKGREDRLYYGSSYADDRTQGSHDPFVFEIHFKTGRHEAAFEPGGLILRDDKGKEHRPAGFYRLASRYKYAAGSTSAPMCRLPVIERYDGFHALTSLSKYAINLSGAVALGAKARHCFAVKFDTKRMDPRTAHFSMTISGLIVDGQTMPAETIHFVPAVYIGI